MSLASAGHFLPVRKNQQCSSSHHLPDNHRRDNWPFLPFLLSTFPSSFLPSPLWPPSALKLLKTQITESFMKNKKQQQQLSAEVVISVLTLAACPLWEPCTKRHQRLPGCFLPCRAACAEKRPRFLLFHLLCQVWPVPEPDRTRHSLHP